jgi:uncharacterized OB-fold protein
MTTSAEEQGDIDSHHKRFWDAAAQGKLLIKRCTACGEHFFYPRPFCPFCSSEETEWVTSSGRGTLYSFSRMRRRGEVFMAPAFVTLEEGPTILTALVDGGEGAEIGQAVEVVFSSTPTHESTHFFRPASR